ncbi:c-type cytochrome [Brevundimonas aveniformis]|uniref:c-type cytochrome n=1 Tax=Brevundimonas aveniformis TaxID=370977 RepID=UPI00042277F7|nr:cytochrome c family protein [Brevundimonas aveniformis]
MRPSLVCGLAVLALAACSQNAEAPASDEAATDTPPAPAPAPRPEMTPEQRAVVLAGLPAPYNAGDLENGRRTFARCRSCHTLAEGGQNMTGPNLWGVFGRRAGSVEGFRYSDALHAADFTWDAEHLDGWLTAPRDFLPGNRMAFAGVPDETERRDLIAYLKVETGYAPE